MSYNRYPESGEYDDYVTLEKFLRSTESRQQYGTGFDDDPGGKRVRGRDAQHVAPPEFVEEAHPLAEQPRREPQVVAAAENVVERGVGLVDQEFRPVGAWRGRGRPARERRPHARHVPRRG